MRRWFAVELRKVLNNIISNASKYMDKKDRKIRLCSMGDFVEVEISDNEGIEKRFTNIFWKFSNRCRQIRKPVPALALHREEDWMWWQNLGGKRIGRGDQHSFCITKILSPERNEIEGKIKEEVRKGHTMKRRKFWLWTKPPSWKWKKTIWNCPAFRWRRRETEKGVKKALEGNYDLLILVDASGKERFLHYSGWNEIYPAVSARTYRWKSELGLGAAVIWQTLLRQWWWPEWRPIW